MIRGFGCEAYKSGGESDKLLAHLNKNNPESMVFSSDSDCLVHGATLLLKPSASNEKTVKIINLEILLQELKMNKKNFIEFSVLLGTDYNDNIPNFGSKKLIKLITQSKNNDDSIFDFLREEKLFELDFKFLCSIRDHFLDESIPTHVHFAANETSISENGVNFFEDFKKFLDPKTTALIDKNLEAVVQYRKKRQIL